MSTTKAQKLVDQAAEKLTEEEIRALADHDVTLGKLMMLEQLEREFRTEAGGFFGRGKDAVAKLMRDWADELKVRHDQLRDHFDTEYHPELRKK